MARVLYIPVVFVETMFLDIFDAFQPGENIPLEERRGRLGQTYMKIYFGLFVAHHLGLSEFTEKFGYKSNKYP